MPQLTLLPLVLAHSHSPQPSEEASPQALHRAKNGNSTMSHLPLTSRTILYPAVLQETTPALDAPSSCIPGICCSSPHAAKSSSGRHLAFEVPGRDIGITPFYMHPNHPILPLHHTYRMTHAFITLTQCINHPPRDRPISAKKKKKTNHTLCLPRGPSSDQHQHTATMLISASLAPNASSSTRLQLPTYNEPLTRGIVPCHVHNIANNRLSLHSHPSHQSKRSFARGTIRKEAQPQSNYGHLATPST